MAEGEGGIELKFRIFDGTDIGHRTYASSTTVATLKERLVAEWPQDKSVIPKSVSDMKLIHAGKFLENSKTLSESRIHIGDLPGGVVTMHVVVQPPVAKKKTACARVSNIRPLIRVLCSYLFGALQTRTRRRSQSRDAHAPSFRVKNRLLLLPCRWRMTFSNSLGSL